MELEIQLRRNVAVGILLIRQPDIQADSLAAGFEGAAVGGFHDPWTAARSHHKAAALVGQLHGPFGQLVGEFARFFVITRHFYRRPRPLELVLEIGRLRRARALEQFQRTLRVRAAGKPCRAKKNYCVLDSLVPKAAQRFGVLRQNAQRAAFRAA